MSGRVVGRRFVPDGRLAYWPNGRRCPQCGPMGHSRLDRHPMIVVGQGDGRIQALFDRVVARGLPIDQARREIERRVS